MALRDDLSLPTFVLYGFTCQVQQFTSIQIDYSESTVIFEGAATITQGGAEADNLGVFHAPGPLTWMIGDNAVQCSSLLVEKAEEGHKISFVVPLAQTGL